MKTIAEYITPDARTSIDYDFATYRQQHNTFFMNKEHELEIRYKNLKDIVTALDGADITNWLQGKTMLGMYKYGKLITDDSDEDVGVDICNLPRICMEVIPVLVEKGFQVIRATPNNSMVSLMRNHRYVDICFFRHDKEKDIYYYENKVFPYAFYDKITNLYGADDFVYHVPVRSWDICKYSYNI